MKLPELKKVFKNKYTIRIVAGVLTVAVIGSGVAVYSGRGGLTADAAQSTESASDTDEKDTGTDSGDDLDLDHVVSKKDSTDVDKEETVYYIADAAGNITENIVIDHLFNSEKAAELTDATSLSDIENIKGDETYEQNGDKIVWKTDGKDIYYRGTSDQSAPVDQKVTYYLDGSEIAPEELAGKSGQVTIRFDYTNNSDYTATVNGKETTVKVPFAAVTTLILKDNFSNVKVTNGKVRDNNGDSIVVGYALPGLKDSLKVEDSDFSEDLDFPEYVEVTADVEDFSLSTAMTVVLNATELSDIKGLDTTELDEKIGDLSDAADKLDNGASDLSDGVQKLDDSLPDLVKGISDLSDGVKAYTDGADQVDDGVEALADGIGTLAGAKGTLTSGVKQLKKGADSLYLTGTKKLVEGYTGTKKQTGLVSGAKSLSSGSKQLAGGLDSLLVGFSGDGTAANPGLVSGTKSLASGADTLAGGLDSLLTGFAGDGTATNPGLVGGTKSLASGADTLASGLDSLLTGFAGDGTATNPGIAKGMESLAGGIDQVRAGIETGDGTAENPGLLSATEQIATGAANLDAGVDQLAAALAAIPANTVERLKEKANTINTQAAAILPLAGGNVTMTQKEDGTLSTNAKTLADALVNKDEVVGKILSSMAAEQSTTVTAWKTDDPTGFAAAKAKAETTYEAGVITSGLLSGLYELQGAVTAANETITTLGSKADDLTKLTDGSEQIKNATAAVYSGVQKLDDGVKTLDTGSDSLRTGIQSAYSGIQQLESGSNDLSSGAAKISSGVDTAYTGVQQLESGSNDLSSGAAKISSGVGTAYTGVQQLESGSNDLSDGAATLYGGVKKLSSGTKKVNKYMKQLDSGVNKLYKNVPTLASGITKLDNGAQKLEKGSSTLVSNNKELLNGFKKLTEGTAKLDDGVDELADGAKKLSDGMTEFNEEAIEKLVNAYNGDVKDFADRIQAVLDAGNAYQSYAGLADESTGSVKFIYKLAEIKADSED